MYTPFRHEEQNNYTYRGSIDTGEDTLLHHIEQEIRIQI
jgi:hypothetical protein